MTKAPISVTIPAGEALSDAADLTGDSLSMILVPPDWVGAHLSFQISDDDDQFRDLIDDQGNEVVRPTMAGCAIPIALAQAAMHLKIRSGTRAAPVPQQADRVLTLLTV
jgi:hypothetical protein